MMYVGALLSHLPLSHHRHGYHIYKVKPGTEAYGTFDLKDDFICRFSEDNMYQEKINQNVQITI